MQIGTENRWMSISAGREHTIALKSDGTLWAWGLNNLGQLGDGTNTDKYSPVQIGTDNKWLKISAGLYHTLGLKSDGTLWVWGDNNFGQLGDGTNVNKNIPVQINTDNWICISGGADHTIGIKANGTLWAWGRNEYGELGDGTNIDKNAPVQIGNDNNWVVVVAGDYNTIGIKSDGILKAWGRNNYGQLGDGTNGNQNIPVHINSEVNKWLQISAGGYHTMGLKSDGKLWAWGLNDSGQLGDGTNIDKNNPVQVGTDNKWVGISCGTFHTLGLKSDGTLWAWGKNDFGQLGDGTNVSKNNPVQISSVQDWVSINAGSKHSMGLKSDGSLWIWGRNISGQLGDGTFIDKNLPVQIGTDNKWVSISGGEDHTIALKSDGTLWAWGGNLYGELGDGTNVIRNNPVQIGTDINWVSISVGGEYTVGIKSDGTLSAWGWNSFGQLGDGTNVNKNTPTQIGTDNKWLGVSGGADHSLGLKSDGTLWAWGRNELGQLGDGSNVHKNNPMQIGTENYWVYIKAGWYHSFGIKSDRIEYCGTGENVNGQLGDGSNANKNTFNCVESCTDPAFDDCPSMDINAVTDAGLCNATVTYIANAIGDPVPDLSYEFTGATNASGSGTGSNYQFSIGTTQVVVTATNDCNTATCVFDVIVSDDEDPVPTCEGPQTIALNGSCQLLVPDLTNGAAATDNCSNTFSWSQSPVSSALLFSGEGTAHTVTVTVNDGNGNSAQCNIILTGDDATDPSVNCPTNSTKNTTTGICFYQIQGTEFDPAAIDNCTTPVLNYALGGATTGSGTGSLNGLSLNLGTTTITWTATDNNGNENSCSFTALVKDIVLPQIDCPEDITITTNAGLCSISASEVNLGNPVVSDNCAIQYPLNNNAPSTYNLGNKNVKWTVSDVNGNTNTCIQKVLVIPNSCAQPIQVYHVDTTQTTAKIKWKTSLCASDYQLRIRKEMTPGVWAPWSSWVSYSGVNLQHLFTNLAPGNYHHYQIRSKCGTVNSTVINGWFYTLGGGALKKQNNDHPINYTQNEQSDEHLNHDEEKFHLNLQLIPNPAYGYTRVKLEGFNSIPVQLSMTDLNGKKIIDLIISEKETYIELDIKRLKLSAGIYFVQVWDGRERIIKKLLVENY